MVASEHAQVKVLLGAAVHFEGGGLVVAGEAHEGAIVGQGLRREAAASLLPLDEDKVSVRVFTLAAVATVHDDDDEDDDAD